MEHHYDVKHNVVQLLNTKQSFINMKNYFIAELTQLL